MVPQFSTVFGTIFDIVPNDTDIVPNNIDIVPNLIDIVPNLIDIVPNNIDIVPNLIDIVPKIGGVQYHYQHDVEVYLMAKTMFGKDVAKLWDISERRVAALCKNGQIKGAVKQGKYWLIPADAEKPADGRIKSGGLYAKHSTGNLAFAYWYFRLPPSFDRILLHR